MGGNLRKEPLGLAATGVELPAARPVAQHGLLVQGPGSKFAQALADRVDLHGAMLPESLSVANECTGRTDDLVGVTRAPSSWWPSLNSRALDKSNSQNS